MQTRHDQGGKPKRRRGLRGGRWGKTFTYKEGEKNNQQTSNVGPQRAIEGKLTKSTRKSHDHIPSSGPNCEKRWAAEGMSTAGLKNSEHP